MKEIWNYVKAPLIIIVATFVLILGSNALSLGAFGVNSQFAILGLAVGLTVAAWVLFFAIGLPLCYLCGFKSPGMIVQTLLGIVSGSLAIWLGSLVLPGAILLTGVLAAVPYATANTLMIWAIAAVTGTKKKGLQFLPER